MSKNVQKAQGSCLAKIQNLTRSHYTFTFHFPTSAKTFRAAYKSKKTSEVARAYLVLSLCGIKPLVKHNDKVARVSNLAYLFHL